MTLTGSIRGVLAAAAPAALIAVAGWERGRTPPEPLVLGVARSTFGARGPGAPAPGRGDHRGQAVISK